MRHAQCQRVERDISAYGCVGYLSPTSNTDIMRRVVLALLFAAAGTGRAQGAIHEYRPEIVLTLPRVQGFGLQLLLEQHLATSNLAPNELTQGIGISSPVLYDPLALRFAMEVRQVIMPAVTEHRYIP